MLNSKLHISLCNAIFNLAVGLSDNKEMKSLYPQKRGVSPGRSG